MPIQEENIVFLESQVLDDVPEGGGAATGRVVPDGKLNNVFDDISDLDRAYGRFNLRKLFLGVRSLDTSLYGGAKLAITALPNDRAIDYAVFTTNDPFDIRQTAANRVAAYLYKGPMWEGVLWENHIVGMRQIRLIQRVGTPIPAVGKTLCLTQFEGQTNEREQYVRVIKAVSEKRTFTDDRGDFERQVVTLDLSDSLRFDFTGHVPNRFDSYDYTNRVRVRDTTVADAAMYYSAKRVAMNASVGDFRIRAESIFASLVPSAQTETPLVNQPMSRNIKARVNAGGGHMVEVVQVAHTRSDDVTIENRRFNWTQTLSPRPRPGTINISFMAMGNWYELFDNEAGAIIGAFNGIGTGTVDYTTGVVTITLGALPDAGSAIIWTWASPVHYTLLAGVGQDTDPRGARLPFKLNETPIVPGSLVVTFTRHDQDVQVTSAADGTITGPTVTGRIDHATGIGELFFTYLPQPSTLVRFAWSYGAPTNQNTPNQIKLQQQLSGARTVSFGQAVIPLSVALRLPFVPFSEDPRTCVFETVTMSVADDGQGNLILGNQLVGDPPNDVGGVVVGNVDYATGVCSLTGTFSVTAKVWAPIDPENVYKGYEWVKKPVVFRPAIGGDVVAAANVDAQSNATAATHEINLLNDGIQIDLTRFTVDRIVPGSVRFTLGGITIMDQGDGILRDSRNIQVGTINYETGTATLTNWVTGAPAPPTVTSCLGQYGFWSAIACSFRVPLAPIKPESLQISCLALNGELLTGISNADGEIIGEKMKGLINYQFGVAKVAFGHYVSSGVPNTPDVWQPILVDPSTLRYHAVAYSYLPLDANILGIDPVRLPSDGRVPVFRKGDIVQIMHTATTAPMTPQLNTPISIGRTRLAWVRVIDANGKTVSGDRYELDRASGTIMFTDLTSVALPLRIKHTVGDLRMLTDVQISGWLQLSRPLTHNYPAGESLIASCLIFGDRRARVSLVFDQASWDGVWSDTLRGSEATATLNIIDFPITVTNEGADTDRWVFRCTNASTHQWELISEKRGLVWQGTYAPYVSGTPVDVRPINPRTRVDLGGGMFSEGVPYMVIPQKANGGGWSTGNIVRINTVGAIADFWIARSIQQSDEPSNPAAPDGCEIYALGNVDRPNE